MNTIILSIAEIITDGFSKNMEELVREKQDVSQLILNTKENLDKVRCKLIEAGLEMLDESVRETPERKKEWYVYQRDMPNTLATIFGELHYNRTYYKNK